MSQRQRITGLLLLLAVAAACLFLAPNPQAPGAFLPEFARDQLVLRSGKLHRPGAETPFEGFVVERYPDGGLKSRSEIRGGVLNGASHGWHTNGALQIVEHFAGGVSHGPRQKWFPNGRLLSEAQIAHGRLEGVFRRWHENGQLAEEIPMANGVGEGLAVAYSPSGDITAQATLRAGKVVAQTLRQSALPDEQPGSR